MLFSPDFYPTPKGIIDYMIAGLDIFDKTILEPSSGKGDIVDHLKDLGAKVLACELNKELSEIVKTKCDNFIGYDFLKVTKEQVSHIDYIIMNPPFSNDESHILHAWEIAPSGCIVKALCNWETINNTYSMKRKELKTIILYNGFYENLGDIFSTSEHKTSIDIGFITLFKPKIDGDDEFDGYFDMAEESEYQENGIIQYNEIREIVNRYVAAIKMFNDVEEISNKINSLASVFSEYNNIKFGAYQYTERNYNQISRETYKKELQKAAWKTVFSKMKMEKYVTQSVKEKLNKFVEKQIYVPFQMSNIYKMIDMVFQTYEQNMNEAIIIIFDHITRHYSENRYAVEGWKSNLQYMINKKVIFPYIINIDYRIHMRISWGNRNVNIIDDLVKTLCFLTGKQYNEKDTLYDFAKVDREFGKWYNWSFFEIKGYKKGTLHVKFKDENTWSILNQRIAKIKGWGLPEKF